MKRTMLALTLWLAPFGPLFAMDPDTSTLHDGSDMGLYGVGLYQELSADVYVGAVYLPPTATAIGKGQSRKMSMRVLIDTLSARKFTRQWLDAVAMNSSRDERAQYAEQLQKFGEAYQSNLIRGDQVSIEYIARGNKTVLLLNDVILAELEGEQLYNILENCWIGNAPLSTQFKAGITRQQDAALTQQHKSRYAALTFSEDRRREVENTLNALSAVKQEQERLATEEREKQAAAEKAAQEQRAREQEQAAVARSEPAAPPALSEAAMAELIRMEAEKIVREKEEAERIAREKAEAEHLAQEELRLAAEQEELRKEYFNVLSRWVNQHAVYPERAERNNLQGKLKLLITCDRSGKVTNIAVDTSSGIADLDEAVTKMVIARADPLPAMPGELKGDSFEFLMPFSFTLDR